MGQVHPLSTSPADAGQSAPVTKGLTSPEAGPPAEVRCIDSAHCGLCGARLSTRALRYHVVSPQSCEAPLTVCHTCRKAAIGEGYRPVK